MPAPAPLSRRPRFPRCWRSSAAAGALVLASAGGLVACNNNTSDPTSSSADRPTTAAAGSDAKQGDAGGRPRLIRIPAGRYPIGSADGPQDERPRHTVRLDAFSIERFPITNAQVAAWLNGRRSSLRQRLGRGPGAPPATETRGEPDAWVDTRDRPLFETNDVDDDSAIVFRDGRFAVEAGTGQDAVVEIPWQGARQFCLDRGGRLPTEVEWEAAARGASGREFPWGDAEPDRERAQFDRAWGDIAPVDAHPRGATPDGILDLAGNVHEWTSTLYRPYPYSAGDGRETPRGLAERSTRGGGHDDTADQLRAAYRSQGLSRAPVGGHHNVGARCAAGA